MRTDRAVGLFASVAGLLAFLVFLLFAVQVLFGLFARTTVSAVAADVAERAASSGAAVDTERWRDEARSRLGDHGDDARVSVRVIDVDGDGRRDTVLVRIEADLPQLLPTDWTGLRSGRFVREGQARIDGVVGAR